MLRIKTYETVVRDTSFVKRLIYVVAGKTVKWQAWMIL